MKKLIIGIFTLALSITGIYAVAKLPQPGRSLSQPLKSRILSSTDTLQQLVEFMYKPAAESFAAFDIEKQFSLFSEKVLLIVPNRGMIVNKDGYRQTWQRIAEGQKKNGLERYIEFRVNHTAWKDNNAFVEGVFRMTTQKPGGSNRRDNYFVYKHTFELVNGKWLLTMDYHTSFDGKVTKEEFEAAKPLLN